MFHACGAEQSGGSAQGCIGAGTHLQSPAGAPDSSQKPNLMLHYHFTILQENFGATVDHIHKDALMAQSTKQRSPLLLVELMRQATHLAVSNVAA